MIYSFGGNIKTVVIESISMNKTNQDDMPKNQVDWKLDE